MAASLPWFRFYHAFINDPVMDLLSFEDQRHFVFLLCLKCNGTLDKAYPKPDMLSAIIARKLGLQNDALANLQTRLQDLGLIDADFQPVSWQKLQFQSDHDLTAAERQHRYRERKRNALRYVDVTGIDTDTDKNNKPLVQTLRRKRNAPVCTPPGFVRFWQVYPHKRDKQRALKLWNSRKLESLADTLVADVERRVANDWAWRKDDGKYIPLPSTYLGNARWEDDMTPMPSNTTGTQSRDDIERYGRAQRLQAKPGESWEAYAQRVRAHQQRTSKHSLQ